MTLTIDISTELANRMQWEAEQQGQELGTVARRALQERFTPAPVWDAPTLAAWEALLNSFTEGDSEDHRDTVQTLAQALNEDRPGQRRVFGPG